MNKSTSHVMVATLFAIAMMSGVATAQVPGDGIPDFYYFPGGGDVMTSQGMITRAAGDLTMDTDGADIVAVFVGCLLYTSPSPRDKRQSRMPSSA